MALKNIFLPNRMAVGYFRRFSMGSFRFSLLFLSATFLTLCLTSSRLSCQTYSASDFKLDLQAAQKGDAAAESHIGTAYLEGNGVKQDFSRARQWLLKAAAQDDAVAEYNLGVMYRDALGVGHNDS